MNDLAIVLISILLLIFVFRKEYYRNKPEPPKELSLAVISFLIGAYFIYEASQGHIMHNHGFVVDSWQIGAMGIFLIMVALYLWRVGINKKEKMKMENNYSQIHEENIENDVYDSEIEWSLLEEFTNHAEAEALQAMLQEAGIPTKLESSGNMQFSNIVLKLYVESALLYKAKCFLQETPSEQELEVLATGEPPKGSTENTGLKARKSG
jgi:hypothetical protein